MLPLVEEFLREYGYLNEGAKFDVTDTFSISKEKIEKMTFTLYSKLLSSRLDKGYGVTLIGHANGVHRHVYDEFGLIPIQPDHIIAVEIQQGAHDEVVKFINKDRKKYPIKMVHGDYYEAILKEPEEVKRNITVLDFDGTMGLGKIHLDLMNFAAKYNTPVLRFVGGTRKSDRELIDQLYDGLGLGRREVYLPVNDNAIARVLIRPYIRKRLRDKFGGNNSEFTGFLSTVDTFKNATYSSKTFKVNKSERLPSSVMMCAIAKKKYNLYSVYMNYQGVDEKELEKQTTGEARTGMTMFNIVMSPDPNILKYAEGTELLPGDRLLTSKIKSVPLQGGVSVNVYDCPSSYPEYNAVTLLYEINGKLYHKDLGELPIDLEYELSEEAEKQYNDSLDKEKKDKERNAYKINLNSSIFSSLDKYIKDISEKYNKFVDTDKKFFYAQSTPDFLVGYNDFVKDDFMSFLKKIKAVQLDDRGVKYHLNTPLT